MYYPDNVVVRLVWLCLLSAIIAFHLSGCSGCSKSGLKDKADKRSYSPRVRDGQNAISKNRSEVIANSEQSLNQLFNKYQSAVFMILTTEDGHNYSQGTGFFVSSSGLAVSNYHVFQGTIKGMESIKLQNRYDLKVEKVLEYNSEHDYIIFKVKPISGVSFNSIRVTNKQPDIGEDVFAITNPRGLENTLSRGIVSGYRSGYNLIQTTAEITHGSSGGPLLNMRGEVVGITTMGLGEANINFAINILSLELDKYID